MKRNIISIFRFFTIKVFNQGSIEVNDRALGYFIRVYKNQINEKFIWEYIAFQMAYWYDKNTKFNLQASWIFGDKAINRWNSKQDNWEYFTQQFLNKVGIERPISFYKANLVNVFEEERARYFNTDDGFMNCLLNACYSEHSNYCKICDFKDICKQQ